MRKFTLKRMEIDSNIEKSVILINRHDHLLNVLEDDKHITIIVCIDGKINPDEIWIFLSKGWIIYDDLTDDQISVIKHCIHTSTISCYNRVIPMMLEEWYKSQIMSVVSEKDTKNSFWGYESIYICENGKARDFITKSNYEMEGEELSRYISIVKERKPQYLVVSFILPDNVVLDLMNNGITVIHSVDIERDCNMLLHTREQDQKGEDNAD